MTIAYKHQVCAYVSDISAHVGLEHGPVMRCGVRLPRWALVGRAAWAVSFLAAH